MRLQLHGGFGEKGRTCLCVESAGYRVLLDAGVKTSARGSADYYPDISANELRAIDAMVLTHAHEDHIAALGWCIERGFRGRIFMTAETQREADACLASYATPEQRALARRARVEPLPIGTDALELGPFTMSTGRSGHMGGCVWCGLDDGRVRLCYCGDIVPASALFAMDPLPRCDAIIIDASYGDDTVTARERAAEVAAWIAAHPQGCVLATPLYGRSAELFAIVEGPVALAPGMREALRAQLEGDSWLVPHVASALAARLSASPDWHPGEPLPRSALLCHDGMGISGPSTAILADAARLGHPALFTGHLPDNSPGEHMIARGQATWIRLPTHPTLAENVALVAASGAARVLGHSCDTSVLARMKPHIAKLDAGLATGDRLEL
jgi:uncharacterized protein